MAKPVASGEVVVWYPAWELSSIRNSWVILLDFLAALNTFDTEEGIIAVGSLKGEKWSNWETAAAGVKDTGLVKTFWSDAEEDGATIVVKKGGRSWWRIFQCREDIAAISILSWRHLGEERRFNGGEKSSDALKNANRFFARKYISLWHIEHKRHAIYPEQSRLGFWVGKGGVWWMEDQVEKTYSGRRLEG